MIKDAKAELAAAQSAVRAARKEHQEAVTVLQKKEKEITRKMSEAEAEKKDVLAQRIRKVKASSKDQVADQVAGKVEKRQQELEEKLKSIKQEHAEKLSNETERIKAEHQKILEEALRRVQGEFDEEVLEIHEKAEKETGLYEKRKAFEEAEAFLEKEEKRLASARTKVESLTGVPVPGTPPDEREQPQGSVPGERRNEPRTKRRRHDPAQAPTYRLTASFMAAQKRAPMYVDDDSYSYYTYSQYSDEEIDQPNCRLVSGAGPR